MKLFANKSAPTDPNDMHLSTLIENNNESMDVNFVGRDNVGNNVYGGNFMEITLGEATKLLDNIMVNYSQWHTERSTNKKVHAIEEINVLSGKMDELMKLFANKSVSSDPNDISLSTLIDNNNESMDVNFVGRNSFGNNAYRGNRSEEHTSELQSQN